VNAGSGDVAVLLTKKAAVWPLVLTWICGSHAELF
jgi:hypothetical protein